MFARREGGRNVAVVSFGNHAHIFSAHDHVARGILCAHSGHRCSLDHIHGDTFSKSRTSSHSSQSQDRPRERHLYCGCLWNVCHVADGPTKNMIKIACCLHAPTLGRSRHFFIRFSQKRCLQGVLLKQQHIHKKLPHLKRGKMVYVTVFQTFHCVVLYVFVNVIPLASSIRK